MRLWLPSLQFSLKATRARKEGAIFNAGRTSLMNVSQYCTCSLANITDLNEFCLKITMFRNRSSWF